MSPMSTTAFSAVPHETAGAAEPRPRFIDLVAAEWIKMRSLRSTYWVLVLSALVAIVINVNAVHTDFPYIDHHRPPLPGEPPWSYDPLFHCLNEISGDLMMLAAASIGAITVFGEYATGMVRTTFTAVPDRGGVMAAKVVVVTVVTFLLGAVVSTASFFTGNAMLASRHVGLSIGDAGCGRAVAAHALIVPVSALIGMAVGAALRLATASIVGVVTWLFLVPLLFGGDRYKLLREIGDILPANAESRLTINPHGHTSMGKYPPTITGSWIALGAWAVVSVIVALVVVRRRDV
jgi:hypothetical protein